MIKKRYFIITCLAVLLSLTSLSLGGCGNTDNAKPQSIGSDQTDYALSTSWLETSAGIKPVDCFYIYPTVTMHPENGNLNISLSNEEHQKGYFVAMVLEL